MMIAVVFVVVVVVAVVVVWVDYCSSFLVLLRHHGVGSLN